MKKLPNRDISHLEDLEANTLWDLTDEELNVITSYSIHYTKLYEEQVSQVSKAFNDAGILVHAYLMYGFPTQTAQETIDSLEIVRQLFENGCVDSGFWHQFAVITSYSIHYTKLYDLSFKIASNQLLSSAF